MTNKRCQANIGSLLEANSWSNVRKAIPILRWASNDASMASRAYLRAGSAEKAKRAAALAKSLGRIARSLKERDDGGAS